MVIAMRILLIEDREIDQIAAVYTICSCAPDATVHSAYDMGEGLRLMADRRLPFDVVFVDQRLHAEAETLSIEALRRAQTDHPARLVMLSGDRSDEARAEALAAGSDAFLVKPLDIARLKDILIRRKCVWDIHDLPQDLSLYRAKLASKLQRGYRYAPGAWAADPVPNPEAREHSACQTQLSGSPG